MYYTIIFGTDLFRITIFGILGTWTGLVDNPTWLLNWLEFPQGYISKTTFFGKFLERDTFYTCYNSGSNSDNWGKVVFNPRFPVSYLNKIKIIVTGEGASNNGPLRVGAAVFYNGNTGNSYDVMVAAAASYYNDGESFTKTVNGSTLYELAVGYGSTVNTAIALYTGGGNGTMIRIYTVRITL